MLALALKARAGRGTSLVAVSAAGRDEHFGVRVGRWVLDGDGVAEEGAFLARWQRIVRDFFGIAARDVRLVEIGSTAKLYAREGHWVFAFDSPRSSDAAASRFGRLIAALRLELGSLAHYRLQRVK